MNALRLLGSSPGICALVARLTPSRFLSAAQHVAFRLSRPPGDAGPNTVGLWRIDEGAGQVVADSSGNGRDGVRGTSGAPAFNDPGWSSDHPY